MTRYVRTAAADRFGTREFMASGHYGRPTRSLNDVMDFDHVVEVHADGSVTDDNDLYGPELTDGELESSGDWTLLTGWTRQYGYRGPIMHSSEFIGGGLADHILETPGYYVALVNDGSCTDECEEECQEDHVEGWAIAFKPAS